MKLSLERKYCIDTSSLIDLDIRYPKEREIYKAIWDEIEELIDIGLFSSSDFVEKEINEYQGKKTFINEWIRDHRQKLIISTDSEIIIAASKIINENRNTGFLNQKKWLKGKDEADPYLIAIGMVQGHIIITQESKKQENKLPQVAAKYSVDTIDLNDFFEERGLKFVKS